MGVAVIGQGFQNSALCDDTAAARVRHARQFRAKRYQAPQLVFDYSELRAGQRVRLLARSIRLVRQREQCPDRIQGKPQFTRMANEVQALQMLLPVHAVTA